MFKDIGKKLSVIGVINQAQKITNFIYNYDCLLAQMQKTCGRNIAQYRAFRFATNYIVLDDFLKKREFEEIIYE